MKAMNWVKRLALFTAIPAALFIPDVSASLLTALGAIAEAIAQHAGWALTTLVIMLAGTVLWRARRGTLRQNASYAMDCTPRLAISFARGSRRP